MKTPTEHLVDEVKNWSFDDWKVLRDDPKLLMQILTTFQKAAPEEFNKLLSSVMVPPTMNNPEVNSILGEPTPTNTEDLYTEEDMQKHFGEQQAEGLDNLLEGLKDTPHDNRW